MKVKIASFKKLEKAPLPFFYIPEDVIKKIAGKVIEVEFAKKAKCKTTIEIDGGWQLPKSHYKVVK